MARKKKEVGPILNEGDIVILHSQIGCEGDVLGVGTVERIKPMAGNPDQDMVWVPGFAPHHPDAVKRIGAPYELIGKLRVLESDLKEKENELSDLKKDLTSTEGKLESALKHMDKATSLLVSVDGNDLLDAKGAIKWIKDAKTKFSLSPIREIGQNSDQATKSQNDNE